MTKEKQIDIIIDILTDFDEMGFAPTTTVPDPETYAIEWRNKLTDALTDYRNRQKAEIERLTAQNGVYETCNARQQEAINSLENSLAISKKETKRYAAQYQTIRSDVAKEIAERLHKYINDFREKREMVMLPYTESALLVIEKKIDNLVKEFTEGGNTAQEVLKKITSKEFKSRPHTFEDMLFDNAKDAMEGG